jgi:hypothetical protein
MPFAVTSGHCPAGTTKKVDCWPMKEVPNNLDTTTGNLGLTDTEENQIVAFLQTLTGTLPGQELLYRQLHDVQPRHRSQLFAVEAREWRTYPDFFTEKVHP